MAGQLAKPTNFVPGNLYRTTGDVDACLEQDGNCALTDRVCLEQDYMIAFDDYSVVDGVETYRFHDGFGTIYRLHPNDVKLLKAVE